MTNLQLTRPVAFIDVETTGLNTQQDRIVDISVIKIHPDGREETLNSMINPGIPIPIEATQIHGITDADVFGKPTFQEFAPRVFQFVQDCDIGGFGVAKFDLLVLESEFQRVEINYSSKEKCVIDAQRIYHKLEPRDLSAAYLKYCNKQLEGAHKSHIDVKATIEVLESQLLSHSELPRDVNGLHEYCNPRDPTWIDADGKLAWFGNNAVFTFGLHKGKTLQDVSKNSADYFNWMLNKDFSPGVKEIIENARKGVFPTKPSV